MIKITVNCDGGSRGNPGPAASAFALEIRNPKSETRNYQKSKYIGKATNNQAEYQAVIEALNWLIAIRISHIANDNIQVNFYLDSQLVVEQLNGRYKLKNEGLKPLFWQVRDLILKLDGKVTFSYIPREQNKTADKLVNVAIDRATKGK